MELIELDNTQRKQLINIQQQYTAWMRSDLERRRMGGMHWKSAISGQQYLYRTGSNAQKSLGARTPELDAVYNKHQHRIRDLDAKLDNLFDLLRRQAPVNKAFRLARVPTIAARILRRLKETPRVDNCLIVVGTNALFAYEATAGIQFPGELTATEDLDLLWNARHQLSLVLPDEQARGIFSLLKSVDHSFERIRSYRAENRDGFIVDIIRPQIANEPSVASPRISSDQDELDPSPIEGLQWIVNAPRHAGIAIAEDGLPVHIATFDPRAYALHKVWLSKRSKRSALKRLRDFEQAQAVANVAVTLLGLSFADVALSALPAELMQEVREFEAAMTKELQP